MEEKWVQFFSSSRWKNNEPKLSHRVCAYRRIKFNFREFSFICLSLCSSVLMLCFGNDEWYMKLVRLLSILWTLQNCLMESVSFCNESLQNHTEFENTQFFPLKMWLLLREWKSSFKTHRSKYTMRIVKSNHRNSFGCHNNISDGVSQTT